MKKDRNDVEVVIRVSGAKRAIRLVRRAEQLVIEAGQAIRLMPSRPRAPRRAVRR